MNIETNSIPKHGDRIYYRVENTKGRRWYQFIVCPDCGIGRWIAEKTIERPYFTGRCKRCQDANVKEILPKGSDASNWQGGRTERKGGYIYVRIEDTSPFYCMSRKRKGKNWGYIPEHRLVMAQHLGRPLKSYELVHHKGAKYPKGSDEDRADNRIENLKLVDSSNHQTVAKSEIVDLYNRISSLESRNTQLEAEVVLLRAQLEKDGIINE